MTYLSFKVLVIIEAAKRDVYLLQKKILNYERLMNDFISTKVAILKMDDIDTRMEYYKTNKSFYNTFKAKDLK